MRQLAFENPKFVAELRGKVLSIWRKGYPTRAWIVIENGSGFRPLSIEPNPQNNKPPIMNSVMFGFKLSRCDTPIAITFLSLATSTVSNIMAGAIYSEFCYVIRENIAMCAMFQFSLWKNNRLRVIARSANFKANFAHLLRKSWGNVQSI